MINIKTKKISSDKVGAVWYWSKEIAEYKDTKLAVLGLLEYKGLTGTKALELIERECENDIDLMNAFDRRELTFVPDFYIDLELMNATSYEEAIEEFEEYINNR